jgi:MATE family multidrug resistance protein
MSSVQVVSTRVARATVRQQVLTLAWPAVIEQMLNMSVGLADTYIVGHLGAAPLAAVGLSVQALNILWALFSAIGVGSTALVARHIGAGDEETANRVAQQSILIALVVGLLGALVLWMGAPIFLDLLGAEPDVVALGTTYLRAVASTVFLLSVLFVSSAILRGSGDTRTPMLVMLAVNGVNIVVAYSLTHGVGSLPGLGVLGSGIGAATARALGGLIMIGLLIRGRGPVRIGFHVPRPDAELIGRVLRIGLPTAGEQLLMRFGQVILASLIAGLGTLAYAAHQIALNAISIAYMPGFGFALAATTLVGQELGAERPDRAGRSAVEAVRMVTVVMSVMGLLATILAPQVMAIFINDPAVIAIGVPALRIAGLSMPFLGISFTLAGGLRGAGDTTSVLIILACSIWLVRVANSAWLSPLLGLAGIWVAIGLDFAIRAGVLALRFRSGKWKLIEV